MLKAIKKNHQTIYIQNQAEFDLNSGKSFAAGTAILFASGAKFSGTFRVSGKGNLNNPNYIGVYNPKTNNIIKSKGVKSPIIEGMGKTKAPLVIFNASNWIIENIEITNSDGTSDNQGSIYGIHVVAENFGTASNITIRNCYIHNVNGKVGGKETGGIRVDVLGDSIISKFDRLIIENNKIEDVGGVGISNQSSWGNITSNSYYPWENIIIQKNKVVKTGRNGIIIRYSKKPIVQYNTVAYSSLYDSGHSIFNFNTTDCLVQFNEVYGNRGRSPNEIDHGAFDADYNSTGTIIQNNYSHDNDWFCGIMRKGVNKNIIIRNNLSINDMLGVFFYGFPKENDVLNVKAYNNTIINTKAENPSVFISNGKLRTPIQTILKNNLFYFKNNGELGTIPDSSCNYWDNCFLGVKPNGLNQEGQAIKLDIAFENTLSNFKNLNAFQRYSFKKVRRKILSDKALSRLIKKFDSAQKR
jgi:hypothetical protein